MKRVLIPILFAFLLTIPASTEEIAGYLGPNYYLLATGTIKGDVYANNHGRTFNPLTGELGFYSGRDVLSFCNITISSFMCMSLYVTIGVSLDKILVNTVEE